MFAKKISAQKVFAAGMLSALLCALVIPILYSMFPHLDYIVEPSAGAAVWRDAEKFRDIYIIPLTLIAFGAATALLMRKPWQGRFLQGFLGGISERFSGPGVGESVLAVVAAALATAVPYLAPHAFAKASGYLLPGVLLHVLYRHVYLARHKALPPSIEIIVATGMLTAASHAFSLTFGLEIALQALLIAQALQLLLLLTKGRLQQSLRLAITGLSCVCVAIATLHWMPSIRLPGEMLRSGAALWALNGCVLALSGATVLEGGIRLHRFMKQEIAAASLYGPVVTVVFSACALALFTPVPTIPLDDYHFGESILPFWQTSTFGNRLFIDLMPAHGLVDLIGQALAFSAFDGTAAATIVGDQIFKMLMHVAAGLLIAGAIPRTALVFVLWALFPFMGIYVAYAAAVLLIASSAQFALFLPIYVIASAFMAFYSIGFGGTLVVASILPVGARFFMEARKPSARLLASALLSSVIAAVIIAMFYPNIKAMMEYVRTSSAVNLSIYGISWGEGWRLSKSLVVEIVRFSWVFSLGIALCTILYILSKRKESNRAFNALVFAFPIVFALLTVPYTNGRIDPHFLSRAGMMAMVLWPLLPVAYKVAFPGRPVPLGAIAATILALAPMAGTPVEEIRHALSAVRHQASMIHAGPDALRFGNAVRFPGHFEEIERIRNALQRLLAPNETFLNATNRNALYFYTGRSSPIPIPAFYNAAPIAFQEKALEKLRIDPPPVVLLNANNMLFDGGQSSIRAHLLYRFILDNYQPFILDGFIFGVLKGEEHRLEKLGVSLAPRALYTKLFKQTDFGALPSAWGRSEEGLEDDFRTLGQPVGQPQAVDLTREADGSWRTEGNDPYLVYETGKLSGRSAGILSFDFACRERKGTPGIQLFWAEEGQPFNEERSVTFRATGRKQIVPLDTDPQWLNAGVIDRIRIDLTNPGACPAFSIESLEFLQRNAVESGL